MGRSGPAPAPPALKLLAGRATGRDSGGRKVDEAPSFVRTAPNAPTWLSAEAKAEWKRIVPELDRLNLLKQPSRAALAAYCEVWATFVMATREVHQQGLTVENHSRRRDGTESTWFTANPAVGVQMKAQQSLRAWAAEFGLTPSAEGRMPKAGDDGEEDLLLD